MRANCSPHTVPHAAVIATSARQGEQTNRRWKCAGDGWRIGLQTMQTRFLRMMSTPSFFGFGSYFIVDLLQDIATKPPIPP